MSGTQRQAALGKHLARVVTLLLVQCLDCWQASGSHVGPTCAGCLRLCQLQHTEQLLQNSVGELWLLT